MLNDVCIQFTFGKTILIFKAFWTIEDIKTTSFVFKWIALPFAVKNYTLRINPGSQDLKPTSNVTEILVSRLVQGTFYGNRFSFYDNSDKEEILLEFNITTRKLVHFIFLLI